MSQRDVHIFCDASECAYGSVAYLRTEDQHEEVEMAFLTARSWVAPKKQQTIPRLELCTALTGAQLAKVVKMELYLPIHQFTLWTDSTRVLTRLHSDSCRFKVFVGTRVAEIQDITDQHTWRYVPSRLNPADDITRWKSLSKLGPDSHWYQGPSFIRYPPGILCDQKHHIRRLQTKMSFVKQFPVFLPASPRSCHSLTSASIRLLISFWSPGPVMGRQATAGQLMTTAQEECFLSELEQLKAGKLLSKSSRLKTLTPELDNETQLIRVGGRLRCSPYLDPDKIHPIVLKPKTPSV